MILYAKPTRNHWMDQLRRKTLDWKVNSASEIPGQRSKFGQTKNHNLVPRAFPSKMGAKTTGNRCTVNGPTLWAKRRLACSRRLDSGEQVESYAARTKRNTRGKKRGETGAGALFFPSSIIRRRPNFLPAPHHPNAWNRLKEDRRMCKNIWRGHNILVINDILDRYSS